MTLALSQKDRSTIIIPHFPGWWFFWDHPKPVDLNTWNFVPGNRTNNPLQQNLFSRYYSIAEEYCLADQMFFFALTHWTSNPVQKSKSHVMPFST